MPPDDSRVGVLLLDIEGTTTPVAFVHQVLFPFARQGVSGFLEAHAGDAEVRAEIEALRQERLQEADEGEAPPPWRHDPPSARLESAVAYVHWLMDRDRKSTALKSLQGRIWEEGYRRGALRGQVYADVPPALERWSRQGKRAAIFSSGSVLAQKLLFSSTPMGDLTPLLGDYFDTTTGPKKEAASYRRIAAALGREPGAILFVSDTVAELDAAREAGMPTALCIRNPGVSDLGNHPVVRSFDEVCP